MTQSTKSKLFLSALLLIFFIPLFSLSGCGGSTSSTTTGTGGGTTPTDLSSLTVSFSASFVTYIAPVTVAARLIDASGAPVKNVSVTFAQDSNLLTFSPAVTALTDGSGTAHLTVYAASPYAVGATNVTASAPLAASTITSAAVGIAVGQVAITLGTPTLGSPSISSYGTSSVSVPVLLNGAPATVPVPVTFNSTCVASGKATLTSPITNVNGTVTSTYADAGCNAGNAPLTDEIIVSVPTGASASANITVQPTTVGSIQFISATPPILQTGGQTSNVVFQVLDSSNNGKNGVVVDFSLLPNDSSLGIILSSAQATSTTTTISGTPTDGIVTTSVTSGAVPTPLWVVAKIDLTPAILTQSNQLIITTGLPTQNFFSLSVGTHNIEGWEYDGVTTAVNIIASDRLGNPVPDGTAINFISEGGQFVNTSNNKATCTTTGGSCQVTFKSAAYKPLGETIDYGGIIGVQGAVLALDYQGNPIEITSGPGQPQPQNQPLYVQNGRVTILAYANGEMSFIDPNGYNYYVLGDTFYDLGQLFLDSNENGIQDTNASGQPNKLEQTIGNFPQGTTVACGTETYVGSSYVWSAYPDDYANVPSVQNSCTGVWGQTYVRRESVMIFSSLNPIITANTFTSPSCISDLTFWLMDENYNPMPAGTTVSIYANNINYILVGSTATTQATLGVYGGSPVPDTTHAGGTFVDINVSPAIGSPCDPSHSVPGGYAVISIATPPPHALTTYMTLYLN